MLGRSVRARVGGGRHFGLDSATCGGLLGGEGVAERREGTVRVAGRHFASRATHDKTRDDAMALMLLDVTAAMPAKRQRTGRGAGTEEAREAFPCVASWEHSDGTAGRPRV